MSVLIIWCLYFPGGSDSKASSYNPGDRGSISGLGRSPGEGHGNPLEYTRLENPWTEEPGSYSPWGRKESDMTERRQCQYHTYMLGIYFKLLTTRICACRFCI